MAKDLNLLHPWVKQKAIELKERAKSVGINIIITQTYRTKAEQDGYYAQGRTKPGKIVTNTKYPNSLHCWGIAFDVAIVNKDGKTLNWSNAPDTDKDGKNDWTELRDIGVALGLEWGGDWKRFVDKPHFQAPNHTVKELQSKYGTPENYIKSWKK